MITIKQIEAVHWAAKLGSFHAAAAKLNTTQSTISKRIQELEQDIGFQIFDRSNRISQVTLKGREFLSDFAEILDLHRRILQKAESEGQYSGRFRLGVTEMVSLTWLPRLIAAITARFPKIVLTTSVSQSATLLAQLRAYQLDLALCPYNHPSDLEGFSTLRLPPMESAWMCRPADAKLYPGELSVGQLASLPLLSYAEGSLQYRRVVDALKDQGATPRETIICSSMVALAELTRVGLGVAYLPRDYFQSFGLAILQTKLVINPLPYSAVFRGDYISSEIAKLAERICDFGYPAKEEQADIG